MTDTDSGWAMIHIAGIPPGGGLMQQLSGVEGLSKLKDGDARWPVSQVAMFEDEEGPFMRVVQCVVESEDEARAAIAGDALSDEYLWSQVEKAGDVPLLVFIGWPWSDGTAGLLSHVTHSDGRPQFQPLELLLKRLGFKPGGVH